MDGFNEYRHSADIFILYSSYKFLDFIALLHFLPCFVIECEAWMFIVCCKLFFTFSLYFLLIKKGAIFKLGNYEIYHQYMGCHSGLEHGNVSSTKLKWPQRPSTCPCHQQ